MRIIDLLKAAAVELNISVNSKADAIDKMIALHEKSRKFKRCKYV